jgi:sulfate permease, SulP family
MSRKPRLNKLIPGLFAGLIVVVIDTFLDISLASLIFSGPLAVFISRGIGFLLFGAATFCFVVALTSSLPGMIAVPQDSTTAILALVAAAIVAAMPASATAEQTFATVLSAIVLITVLTGLFFLVLGQLRSSRLVRYIPYPVIGGFLAGTGWVIVRGAMSVLTGTSFALSDLSDLFQPDILLLWLPALVFAVLLLVVLRRVHHPLALPVMLVIAVGLFYISIWIRGISVQEAQASGWLLGPFPTQMLWQPYSLETIQLTNWSVIVGQAFQVVAVLVISVLGLLFNVSGLEMTVGHDIDLDRELRAAGLANLVAGAGGSPVGFQALSYSSLAHRMRASTRLAGVAAGLFFGLILLLSASLLSFIPKVVVGGLLLYLGLAFLVEWIYEAWFKLPRSDYALVILILVIIGGFGFLQGVAVGLGIAIISFVVNYSRVNIVKHTLSGEHYHSTIIRSDAQRQYLREHGEQTLIIGLQGFLFFGTAYNLQHKIQQRVRNPHLPPVHYIVLDFRLVNGFDSSVVSIFTRLQQLAESEDLHLVITGMSPGMQTNLAKAGIRAGNVFSFFPSLDYGVESCENTILESAGLLADESQMGLRARLEKYLPSRGAFERLRDYLVECVFQPGDYIVHQDELADCMYFIESGMVSVQLELEDGSHVRVRTIESGSIVGEIGLYLGDRRTASVVAIKPCMCYQLCTVAFQEMQDRDPDLAAALHRWIATLLAERLSDNVKTLRAVLE